MGLFGFGKPAIDKQLIELYSKSLQATFGSQARATAKEWVQMARQKAEAEGTLDLHYDAYMRLAEGAEESKRLAAKREDGVTEEDLQLWWGLHDMERRMTVEEDETSRIVFYVFKLKEKGISGERIIEELRKSRPVYGDPTDTATTLDDRPLPYELKDRVNRWLENQFTDPDTFETLLAEYSTFNALIRSKIRANEI